MSQHDLQFDNDHPFDAYSALDPEQNDRHIRRARKKKINKSQPHKAKKSGGAIVSEIADVQGLEGGFNTTYRPQLFETGWLLEALRPFYDRALISDVLGVIKGGKEANVYRCAAEIDTDILLAAKVYRPRMFRNLRNDAMYKEGRAILGENGRALKERDRRAMKAISQKTGFGAGLSHSSWVQYEYNTLQTLYAAGASVPRPVGVAANAILMGYIGDETLGAPTLSDVNLERDEAPELFADTMRNIELMLQHGMVHGDLSAYNILYWEGEITFIDFPQVTDSKGNSNARMILSRDVARVCDYFAGQGVKCDAEAEMRRLWQHYLARSPRDLAADYSRFEVEEEEED